MSKTIKVALAGAGAFGLKHLDAIKLIDGVEAISLVGRELDKTKEAAAKYGVGHVTTDLAESLKLPGLDAVILATPTQMHAAQALQCLKAGKHVQVEIPLADSLTDAEAVVAVQKRTGLVAMCGHTRRFNPSHQFVRQRILKGEFHIQQMDVQTYFFRRTNMNALGQPRSWTDHLLWHHAAHTVDLFAYQCRSPIVKANALQGPIHPTLGIAMDMSIQLKAENGAICTLSLSFNNEGPLGTFFRYIGDSATYIARYDDLFNGKDEKIDVSKVDVSHERHRTAGPRVLRRDPRGPRAQRQRRTGAALLPRARRPRAADGVAAKAVFDHAGRGLGEQGSASRSTVRRACQYSYWCGWPHWVDLMRESLFSDPEALASLCRRYRIRRLSLFGSTLKSAARPDSDVDLLVEFEPDARPSAAQRWRKSSARSRLSSADGRWICAPRRI